MDKTTGKQLTHQEKQLKLNKMHRVVESVKKNLQLDWTKKEDARAAIRLAVKKELKGKVPFSALDKILQEVIEQAEGQYSDWPLTG